jgi:hypothetical protein
MSVALSAFGGTIFLRTAVVDPQAAARRALRIPAQALASPGPRILKLVSFEYAHAIADLIWLGIVQDLGHRPDERDEATWDRVYRSADIATDLDERYFTVYYTTAVQLTAWARRADKSDAMLQKGVSHLPDRWEFPFLIGYNAYFLHGDPTAAADVWESAIALPNSPRFIPSLAARARFQAGDEAGAIMGLETMLQYLDGPLRDDAIIRLKILRSEAILRLYDEACKLFQAEHGRVPKDGRELFEARLVKGNPEPFSLLGEPILIDENCRARTAEFNRVREDEAAKERIGSQAQSKAPEKQP